jgi:hypothetical protein
MLQRQSISRRVSAPPQKIVSVREDEDDKLSGNSSDSSESTDNDFEEKVKVFQDETDKKELLRMKIAKRMKQRKRNKQNWYDLPFS